MKRNARRVAERGSRDTRPAAGPYPSGVAAGRARGGSHPVPSRKDRDMRTTLALGLAVAFGALAAADDKKFDAAKLEGNWEYKSGEKNGQKLEGEPLKPKIKITKDTITVGEGDMLFEFKYTLDAKKDPVAIDMTM